MDQLLISPEGSYRTPTGSVGILSRLWPTFTFYLRFLLIVFKAGLVAKSGRYTGETWAQDSLAVLRSLEAAGLQVQVTGIDHIKNLTGPVVFIGNHMSMMETVLLPGIIRPLCPVTFVIKESLLKYPIFKHVMAACQPVAVTRTNPRQDLKTVLDEGGEKLAAGMSIIVFPQTTRATAFSPEQMSSIGVKLAKRAGVPIIPLALKTDAWQNGKILKDFGTLKTTTTAFFAFGSPISVTGKGEEEQQRVCQFIADNLAKWQG